jgi:hypothetical protein
MFGMFILILFYRYDRVTALLWIRYPGILLGEGYNWHLYACRLFCALETPTHVFNAYASVDTPWVAHALSLLSPRRYARVLSNSMTNVASKFARPQKIPYAPIHNSKLSHSDPTNMGLNRHRRGLPPWSSEF